MTAPRWPMCGPPSARAPVNPHGEPAALAPGYALIRLDDLAALLHDRQAAPEVTPTWPGLAGAVALLTEYLSSHPRSLGALPGDMPPGPVIGALVVLVSAALDVFLPGAETDVLRQLGLTAALRTAGTGGEDTAP